MRTPFPIHKISSTLQEMEGFTFAITIDLNMEYYTIRLDPEAQKICTIILPWGKYLYLRLPMGIPGAPTIFQEKMTNLLHILEYVHTYIDGLLVSNHNHIEKVKVVLDCLQLVKLLVNVKKSNSTLHEIE